MPLGMEVGLSPGDFVFNGDPAVPPQKRGEAPSPIIGPCLLWPNGWIDQYGTWYGGGPWSRPHRARWGPSSPPPKRDRAPQFSAHFLSLNGWMDQDGTWYGGRPHPRRLCVRWGPSFPSPKGAQSPQLSANVRCGQTTGRTKMALGMEVGLGPGDSVFDGDPATPEQRAHPPPPSFRPMFIVAIRLDE